MCEDDGVPHINSLLILLITVFFGDVLRHITEIAKECLKMRSRGIGHTDK